MSEKNRVKTLVGVDATSLSSWFYDRFRIFIVTSAMARDIGYCPVDNMGGYGFYY
jgi:hypothetical protein